MYSHVTSKYTVLYTAKIAWHLWQLQESECLVCSHEKLQECLCYTTIYGNSVQQFSTFYPKQTISFRNITYYKPMQCMHACISNCVKSRSRVNITKSHREFENRVWKPWECWKRMAIHETEKGYKKVEEIKYVHVPKHVRYKQ